MRKIAFLILMTTICSTAFGSQATLIEKLEKRFKGVKSIKGTFRQTTIFPDGEKKVFEGVFYITKDKSRWDYQRPEKQTVITIGRKVFIFDPVEKSMQQGEIDNSIFSSSNLMSNIKALKKSYRIKENGHTLHLYPLKESNISDIAVEFDDELNISKVTTTYKTGEKIILEFTSIKYNAPIPESVFSIEKLTGSTNVY